MSSQTVCCDNNNVFTCAKIVTGIDIVLSIIAFFILGFMRFFIFLSTVNAPILIGISVIKWAYLATEFIGIHKKIQGKNLLYWDQYQSYIPGLISSNM